jgi:hypothetical protein
MEGGPQQVDEWRGGGDEENEETRRNEKSCEETLVPQQLSSCLVRRLHERGAIVSCA